MDGSRLVRPLMPVAVGRLLLVKCSWSRMVINGLSRPDTSHMELGGVLRPL